MLLGIATISLIHHSLNTSLFMTRFSNSVFSFAILLFAFASLMKVSPLAANQFIKNSAELEKQRQIFATLIDEQKLNKVNPQDYKTSLGSYPLFPYLEYLYLVNRVSSTNLETFEEFFKHNESLASSSHLRKQLLLSLANKKDWDNFKRFYKEPSYFFSESSVTDLQCFHQQAQLLDWKSKSLITTRETETTENAELFFNDEKAALVKTIYLTGESLPDSCNAILEHFEQENLLSDALKLTRIQLAITENNIGLANFIANSLSSDVTSLERNQYKNWSNLHSNPNSLENADYRIDDTTFNRFAVIYALKKILQNDPPLALILWKEQSKHFSFTKDEIADFLEDAANYLYINDSEHADTWLELANARSHNENINQKMLVRYIKTKNWPTIIQMYERLSTKEKNESIWQYWYARSYIEYDQNTYIHPNAYRILNQLSGKRDYYGFLASFHLNNAPVFSRHQFPIKEKSLESIADNIGIVRAHEFYMLKDRINASREWLYAIKDYSPEQKGDAAVLAYQWGWLEQAIITAAKSNQFNNITLRFPLGFAEHVNFYSSKYGIPNEWVFATIRQESAYGLEAESRVGALGLMQIMPSTAKVLARETKLKKFSNNDLLNPDINIQLGTYYLAQLRKQYNGNMLLASAAYNAGPSRVNAWIKNKGEMDVEMWIETIPYKETRDYVKNILAYQIIYQQELGREINSERLFLPINAK